MIVVISNTFRWRSAGCLRCHKLNTIAPPILIINHIIWNHPSIVGLSIDASNIWNTDLRNSTGTPPIFALFIDDYSIILRNVTLRFS